MTVIRTVSSRPTARLARHGRAHRAHGRNAGLATAALLVALAVPASAPAQLPPNNGGVDQYVAPGPDSRGGRPAHPGHPRGGSSPPPGRGRSPPPAGAEGAAPPPPPPP